MLQILTVKVRLYPDMNQKMFLDQTMEQYRVACTWLSQCYFDNNFTDSQRNLHDRYYKVLRTKFMLKSQMAESVIKIVLARYKTVATQLRQNPYRYQDCNTKKWYSVLRTLTWLQKPIMFKRPQIDLVATRDWSFVNQRQQLSLNTIKSRIKLGFDNSQLAKLSPNVKLGTAKLVKLKKCYFLHISTTETVPDFVNHHVKHVVGIDRGLRFLTTSYDEQGKTSFVSGKQVLQKRRKFKKLRQQLQAKNTKSAKRRLKKLGQRENRWMTDINHQISKTLVERYGNQTLFVMEDLTNVRFATEKNAKTRRYEAVSWSFYQLEQFLNYKANRIGSKLINVDAHYTSQRDPKTGEINKNFRNHAKHEFYNSVTGTRSNDDRIGAMNIYELGKRYLDNEPVTFVETV